MRRIAAGAAVHRDNTQLAGVGDSNHYDISGYVSVFLVVWFNGERDGEGVLFTRGRAAARQLTCSREVNVLVTDPHSSL